MNGVRLLKLNKGQIQCLALKLEIQSPKWTQSVFDLVSRLQQRCKGVDRDYLESEPKTDSATKRLLYPIDRCGVNRHRRWSEDEVRESWHLHIVQNQSYFSIAQAIDRTETAVLQKMNRIKRAIAENPDVASLPHIYQPYEFKGYYVDIIADQKMRERAKGQLDRFVDNELFKITEDDVKEDDPEVPKINSKEGRAIWKDYLE